MRILIADDSAVLRAQLQDILQEAGFDVVVAEDGLQAWEALREGDIRLAVLDWLMPGIDGVELCRKLASEKKLQTVYVILLTGRNSPEEMAESLEAGASDYVTKPFSEIELLARVRAAGRVVELQSLLAQSQKLESIGELAAGIAHEINTPIQYIGDNGRFLDTAFGDLRTVLHAYSHLLHDARSTSPDSPCVREVQSAIEQVDLEFILEETPVAIRQSLEGVEQVANIVGAMKEFSHPGSTEKVLADIHKAIENTITIARSEWKSVAEVITDFDPNVPQIPCLLGDINQVLLNLIVNAAQAIAEKSGEKSGKTGTITIRTLQLVESIEIQIEDNGCGIPQKNCDRVFDPFFTSKGKGS